MNIIAFCDGVLASDSRCSDGSDNGEIRKIWRLRNGYLFGGAGDAGFCSLVRHWLERHAKDPSAADRPEIYEGVIPSFAGLLVSPAGVCFVLDHYLAPIETLGGPQAVGSGAPHALALMKTGLSAEQAISRIIEQQLADGVGGAIQVLTLNKRKAGKSKSS